MSGLSLPLCLRQGLSCLLLCLSFLNAGISTTTTSLGLFKDFFNYGHVCISAWKCARERRILRRSEVSALEVEAQVVVTSVDAGD